MAKETTRVQLELPAQSFDRLQLLKEKTEASSYAEVIKNALRLYEAMVSETERGNEVSIKDTTGKQAVYRLLF